jgi:sugar phosphate isomerase/epimerase
LKLRGKKPMEVKNMSTFKIGIIADGLRLPFRESIEKCAEMGADGVQLYAVEGEMAPENMSAADVAEKRRIIQGCGLEVSALCGDLGGHGFTVKEENRKKIEKSKRIVDLALELGSNIVTTHIGVIPADQACETYFKEEPLGKGDVDFVNYIKALREIGYQGFLTIERELGPDPVADIVTAVRFLNTLI